MMPQQQALLTPWGEQLDRERPLPEYPRPQLQRASYLNLNGVWQHAFRISARRPEQWDGPIVVPFSPEAVLSGVGRQLQPGEYLHYQRTFDLPTGFRADRVLLHFGAVDQWCRITLNGSVVGEHDGGFLPFSVDVTDSCSDTDNDLHVVVQDPSDTGPGARGKQKLQPGGIWYTAQSGIWQTVWLESVPELHVTGLTLEPDLTGATITVRTTHPTPVTIGMRDGDVALATAAGTAGQPLRIDVPEPHLWTPDDPHLYDLTVRAGADEVASYVGLRTFGIAPDAGGRARLLLNGQPYFHAGVLDQGYWSDGLLTAASDEALIFDIQTMKDMGFTMLRKHIKVEPLRWYHHCDRIGMLVWQDMVNGGGPYRRRVVELPAVSPVRFDDRHRRLFSREDDHARAQWLSETRETVELLRNSPCVAAWVPFNEGWGQFDANEVAETVRLLDPSRPVDHASGWHDQGGGDFHSLHVYFRPFRVPRKPDPRVLALSEYGGYSLHLSEHSASPTEFGYRRYSSVADLAAAFRRLHADQIIPAIPKGLSATVYTQVSDVEDETNGLLTFDRRVVKIPVDEVRQVIQRLRVD